MKWNTVSYVCVLLCDLCLWLLLLSQVLLLRLPGCGGLAGLWTFAIFKWILIHKWILGAVLDQPTPVPYRFAALLCLLLPLFESGRALFFSPSGGSVFNGRGLPDLGMVALSQISSIIACALWDIDLIDHGQAEEDKGQSPHVGSRVLLRRVLTYFSPDRLYLFSAFGFLILGGACKYIHVYIYTSYKLHCSAFDMIDE